eukprot:44346_1
MSMSTKENDELLPLSVTHDGSTDKENQIESYGTMISKTNSKYRELKISDILIFTLMCWNIYLTRKMMYPFTKEFSEFYNISINSFSFILSAFDLGGAATIILTVFPALHHIRIHLLFFLLMFTLAILYFLLSFCSIFITLFIVRLGMGFLSTTMVGQIRGILGVFTKEYQPENESNTHVSTQKDHKLTIRILLVESAWFTSSVGWIVVGVILNRLNVIYVFYFGCICAAMTACLCYFLPSFTTANALAMKSQSNLLTESDGVNTVQNILQIESLWKQYHLYFLNNASFFFGMAYAAFLATFGPYMQVTFHLNAEQLGFQTFFISSAELFALFTTNWASKYKSNIWLALFSSSMCVLTSLVFVIGLSMDIMNEIFVWILLFVMTVFIESTMLNMIVANLHMTPHGLESKSATLLQTTGRASNVIGVIIGAHIQVWYGFGILMRYILVAQFVALISYCAAGKQFKRRKINT